MDTISKTWNY